jgi:outer membrane murein-binding lipoprotein Lpp
VHDVGPESLVKWTNVTRTGPSSPSKPSEPVTGAAERPPLRIDSGKNRVKRSGVTLLQIALATLFFMMIGALAILTFNEQRTAQRLDQLTADVQDLTAQVKVLEGNVRDKAPANPSNVPTTSPPVKPPITSSAPSAPTILSIDPPSTTLQAGQTARFKVVGTGSSNLSVLWKVQQDQPLWGLGKINATTGVYTSPPKIAKLRTVTIIATVKNKPLYARVTLVPAAGGQAPVSPVKTDGTAEGGDVPQAGGNKPLPSDGKTPSSQSPAKTPAQQDPIKKNSDLVEPSPVPSPSAPLKAPKEEHSESVQGQKDPSGTTSGTEHKNQPQPAKAGPDSAPTPPES